jgi:carboxyl-terminal processing protease
MLSEEKRRKCRPFEGEIRDRPHLLFDVCGSCFSEKFLEIEATGMLISQRKKGLVYLIFATGLFVVLNFCYQITSISTPSKKIPEDARADFGLMAEAWRMIQAHYVDRAAIQPRALTYGAIGGMVDALGDTGHSTFLSPQMIKEEQEYTTGEYKGIGAEVRMKDGHVVIVTPLDGSPAQKAGLQPGQIILQVNGADIAGLSLIQVVKRISGRAGTQVTLKVFDPSTGLTREVSLVRASITVNNVSWNPLPGTKFGHLRIAGFSHGVSQDLEKALQEIKREQLQGLILDLRNNPGGLLGEAVSTASQFLAGGNVLLEKNAKGRITPVAVKKGEAALHIPMVGLVNGGTASAAEIVAGALQDYQRASLVGTTTFGTGTVLQQFPLSDGSALLLAVQEWLTPDGHTIWHKGINPKLVVPLPADVLPLFPEEERNMTSQQLQQSRDTQLLKALNLLSRQVDGSAHLSDSRHQRFAAVGSSEISGDEPDKRVNNPSPEDPALVSPQRGGMLGSRWNNGIVECWSEISSACKAVTSEGRL